MSRSMVLIRGGNNNVMTPVYLADAIINHYQPAGRILEPCRGLGPTYAFWREGWDYCELKEGIDFLQEPCPAQRYDWIATNPPYSQFRAFLRRSMMVADNVVFLCNINAFWLKARIRDIDGTGFGIRGILLADTPGKETGWSQSGFQLGAVYLKRGWNVGSIEVNRLPSSSLTPSPQVG